MSGNGFLVASFTERVLAATVRLKTRIDDLETKLQEGMPVADLTEIENAIALINSSIALLQGETAGLGQRVEDLESPDLALGNPGSLTLPGGLIMKWGTVSDGTGAGTGIFSTPFPTVCYSVVISPFTNLDVGRIAHVKTVSATGFTFYRATNAGTASAILCSYLAVGR